MNVHMLKTWPSFFADLVTGVKPFELRKNDRDYRVGDWLVLVEWRPTGADEGHHTGRWTIRYVSYVLPGGRFGLDAGYAVLGIDIRRPGPEAIAAIEGEMGDDGNFHTEPL